MILADKIMNERKKNGWSQEELADQLGVSRQSVSKWEGAQSVPDLQKIIQMSQIFGVSTDYLLKDEMEKMDVPEVLVEEVTNANNIRRVSMQEANEYIECSRETTPKIALGTILCILSPVTLLFLTGLCESGHPMISEALACGVGLITLFIMISIAVALFITSGTKINKFEYLKQEDFETEYGVIGFAKELKEEEQHSVTMKIVVGVILCICCAIPLITAALVEAADSVLIWMVCVLLCMVAVAVYLFISAETVKGCCDVLLQEGEYTTDNKKSNKKVSVISSAYWSIVVVIYLGWSFYTMDWDRTWIVWPVAGVLQGVISVIIKARTSVENM